MEVKSSSEYDGIHSAISEFEKALADGHDLEIAILDDLARLWNIDLSNLNPEAKEALGADVERITDKHISREAFP